MVEYSAYVGLNVHKGSDFRMTTGFPYTHSLYVDAMVQDVVHRFRFIGMSWQKFLHAGRLCHARRSIVRKAGIKGVLLTAWREDEENVDYVLGLAKNSKLKELCAGGMAEASAETRKTGKACRRFCEFTYRTQKSWFRAAA